MGYLWKAYFRIRRRTAHGFNGPQPIGWPDIDTFLRRSGLRFAPWEIGILERLDDIYLSPGAPSPTAPDQPAAAVASPDNVAGVRAILGSVGKRRVVKRKKGG